MQRKCGAAILVWQVTVVIASIAMSMRYVGAVRLDGERAPRSLAEQLQRGAWNTFDADITIRGQNGEAQGTGAATKASAAMLHVERQLRAGRWRTVMHLKGVERPTVRSAGRLVALDNPFAISRMEYDDDGAAARLYDRRGNLVRLPTARDSDRLAVPAGLHSLGWRDDVLVDRVPSPMPARADRGWISSLIVRADLRDERRSALATRYGAAAGRVLGLDQYQIRDGRQRHEVLVDPADVLPREINTFEDGVLVSHSTLTFAFEDGLFLRRALHNEQRDAARAGRQTTVDIVIDHVELSERRAL
jgi:hypothetical protein